LGGCNLMLTWGDAICMASSHLAPSVEFSARSLQVRSPVSISISVPSSGAVSAVEKRISDAPNRLMAPFLSFLSAPVQYASSAFSSSNQRLSQFLRIPLRARGLGEQGTSRQAARQAGQRPARPLLLLRRVQLPAQQQALVGNVPLLGQEAAVTWRAHGHPKPRRAILSSAELPLRPRNPGVERHVARGCGRGRGFTPEVAALAWQACSPPAACITAGMQEHGCSSPAAACLQ
jgi:hypothetical protein